MSNTPHEPQAAKPPHEPTAGREGSWPSHWIVEIPDQAGIERLGAEVALILKAGDLVTLSGGLGCGKTTFARSVIRALADDPELEVPSPTFMLIQTYDTRIGPLVHADLYRIAHPQELDGIGWNETSADAVVLVEWAEKIGTPLAPDRLEVSVAMVEKKPEARLVSLTGHGAFAARLAMAKAIHYLLRRTGYSAAVRHHLQGDASTRAYERLELSGPDGIDTAILMIAPKRPDGPPVRNGKPYSQIVHLAEDVNPFVALARGLGERGFSAPEILGADLATGLLLIEDFGDELTYDANGPIEERYGEAVAALAALHQLTLPRSLAVEAGVTHQIPPYDLEALGMETELLLDWYLPHKGQHAVSVNARVAFIELWDKALRPVLAEPLTWTLRDYHSPNLIWLPEREGIQRVGILDFQDCVIGPPAYDVASLLQDARIDVPDEIEIRLLGRYARLRKAADPSFDTAAFARAYAVMGAQRATKILGIFARLNKRDGKPQYLKHLPRIERNIRRCLAHPALADLRGWYQANVPDLLTDGR